MDVWDNLQTVREQKEKKENKSEFGDFIIR